MPSTIHAIAPCRICDIGGWTDTWFAKSGNVVNMAIYPYVEVHITTKHRNGGQITINAHNYGESINFDCDNIDFNGKHDLLKAAFKLFPVPESIGLDIIIKSQMPPGASTGTSAAVSTALVGALARLLDKSVAPYGIAELTHQIETKVLKLQCGVQDQLASAIGGINNIHIANYPSATVEQVPLADEIWWELERRMVLVYLGASHNSSQIHSQVIKSLESNPDSQILKSLQKLAISAANYLWNGDFNSFGQIMDANTKLQSELHPELVSEKAKEVFDLASFYNVCGKKVNGAGGNGGSVSLLFNENEQDKTKFIEDLDKIKDIRYIPIYLSRRGLRVW
jgi:D-glycero-alpha-D-manno-heptose-7-phosphate kinase